MSENTLLELIDVPHLATIGQYMRIYSNSALQRIDASHLTIIGWYLQIYDNDELSVLDVSALASLNAASGNYYGRTCTPSGSNEDLCV
mgnify:CR=1 FL=1